ncbi:prepilin-type N-terminal cleavage/methylation domain-containing protein [Bacillus mesophilus]|uniref:type II secretion system protein n=1 Tax=Bacillus mesophilus TaxID=1808955 RepID=UPI0023BADA85|nr:prepilin-type N-terminal cleavage/methylation domain-containing protein [Bacillus mesophilus]MBM7662313.1 prepilin-type N-terminal cleavage/methylation domain-containing protein [Bacillus mesophilus]
MLKALLALKERVKNQRGLTLIELLVVIVILGIIAAIAIPMVMSQQDNAAKNTNAQNLSIVQDAVNRYYTLNNGLPSGFALNDLLEAESGTSHIGGPFLDSLPAVKTFTSCSGAFQLNASNKVAILAGAAASTTDNTAACTQ